MAEIKKNVLNDFGKLRNLILMEEFLNCIGNDIRTHIADRGVEETHPAAVLADNYVLIHQTRSGESRSAYFPQTRSETQVNTRETVAPKAMEGRAKVICFYCKKEGHLKKKSIRSSLRRLVL